MDIILLAGNSKKNQIWIEDIGSILKPVFNEVIIQYYSHWQDVQESIMDLDQEEKKLVKLANQSPDYVLFGKSIGAVLGLETISKGIIHPAKCVFAGTAINWADSNGLDVRRRLRNYSVPTLFLQNTNDPAISSVELKKILLECGVSNHEFVDLPGDTHDYSAVEIARLIKKYCSKNKTA